MLPDEHAQAMVDRFAQLAKPRLLELLQLKDTQLMYTPNAGDVSAYKTVKTTQPYKNIERFLGDDRVMPYIVDPGLVPIAKAIRLEVRGRKLLATRNVPAKQTASGVAAYVDGFGIRISMSFDAVTQETKVTWECLYRVE
jgi:hypothetical protein